MKISTIRSLLFVLDLALMGGVAGVVSHGMDQRQQRNRDRQTFETTTYEQLKLIKTDVSERTERGPLREIENFRFDGTVPEAPKPVNAAPEKPKEKVYRPLDELMSVIGAEMHGKGVVKRSFILYTRTGDAPLPRAPATTTPPRREPSRGRGGSNGNRSQPRARGVQTPASVAGPLRVVHRAYLGDAIEFSEHEIAVVEGVRSVVQNGQVVAWQAVFDYSSQEVAVSVLGDPGGPKSTAAPEPTGPINIDPGTWIAWVPSKPHEINVTEMGARAFKRDGEKVLEGVRWGTESIGGKKVLKVSHIPKGSALERGGAKPGDAFESINGVPISTKADIVRYVKANPNLPSYTVTFWRQGRRLTRTVNRPQSAGS
ncbi:MAG: hypothetical protein HRU14_02975 [Planctomycetes bacterium]|nr:hypothetical protein [Planctomycetota bacterium]